MKYSIHDVNFEKMGKGDVIIANVGTPQHPPNPLMMENAQKYFEQIVKVTPAFKDAMDRGARFLVLPYYLTLQIAKDAPQENG